MDRSVKAQLRIALYADDLLVGESSDTMLWRTTLREMIQEDDIAVKAKRKATQEALARVDTTPKGEDG